MKRNVKDRKYGLKTVSALLISVILLTSLISYVAFSNPGDDDYVIGEGWMKGFWLSPAEEYVPLMFRTNDQGVIHYVDPYFIIRVHNVTDQYISWLAFGRLYDFGTYECKAKAENNVTNTQIALLILEKHHGWGDEGLITVLWDGTPANERWILWTTNGTDFEKTEIVGVDFTSERTIKIEWTSTYVKCYIDDVLKATNTLGVPQSEMQLAAEVMTLAEAPVSEPKCYFREGSFRELG